MKPRAKPPGDFALISVSEGQIRQAAAKGGDGGGRCVWVSLAAVAMEMR